MQKEKDQYRIQKETGPSEIANSDAAPNRGSDKPPMVDNHDSEKMRDRQGTDPMLSLDGDAGSLEVTDSDESPAGPEADRNALYDSGWTVRDGFRVRTRWYGVGDHGVRRQWAMGLLYRPTV